MSKTVLFLAHYRRIRALNSLDPEQGFTMFEVLVALMMSFLFLTGTLNAMVVATLVQVRAERQAQATYWIQEDLEQIRALAASFNPTSGNGCPSGVGTAFRDNSANGGLASFPLNPSTRNILNQTYTIARNPNPNGNVLQFNYTVSRTVNAQTETLATLYTEVLPLAALSCP